MLARFEERFYLLACGRVRTWLTALTSHTRTVFYVPHLVSPLASFFNDMGSSLPMSSVLLVQNSLSIDWKRWRIIFLGSDAPPPGRLI